MKRYLEGLGREEKIEMTESVVSVVDVREGKTLGGKGRKARFGSDVFV